MGSWSASGLSGSGHAITGATAPYTDLSVTVTAMTGTQRTIGFDPLEVQHVKFVGIVGLGCFADDSWGCSPPAVQMWDTIQFVAQDFNIQPRWGNIFGPSIFWALKPGATIDLYVGW